MKLVKLVKMGFFAALAAACNVEEPPGTSGVGAGARTACGEGFVVAASDYASTNVALLGFDARVLSPSLLSSGSTAPGTSAALSGDVVAPLAPAASGEVVLIDRYPNAVLTWMDPRTARARAQLSVATGFASNPHDYLQIDERKAYVTRYETNAAPGRQPMDEGGDVVVVDPVKASIASRIPLAREADGDLLPRADRMLRVGDHVLVTLQRFDRAFKRAGDARIVGIDARSDDVAWTLDLPGIEGCAGMAQEGTRVVVACSGAFHTGETQLDRSAVVVLDTSTIPPKEIARHAVARKLGGPVAPSIALASRRLALGVVYGDVAAGRGDRAFSLDIETGAVNVLARASGAFVLGDARCATACAGVCVLADAEGSGLRVFRLAGDALEEGPLARLGDRAGLPPRYVGAF